MVKVRILRSAYGNNNGRILDVTVNENGDYVYGSGINQLLILKQDAEVVEDVCNSILTQSEMDSLLSALNTDVDCTKTGTTEEAKHYQVADVQPIELMQATMSKEQFEGYLLGNVIKYALRLNYKGQKVSDAGKCKQYAEWLQVAMNGGKIIPGGK